ncbi:calmodulin [Bradyrhizobium lablabi]|uniref:BP74-related protein n=1 Tax=Bradyrhizobium lablabi TaxID=722472 RepID=UPI001BADF4A8|nr:calmodulin [Bradyrhizobium lablabi]MBR0695073.1 calmodulin [Bradyrhizobium lablabi]
MKHWKATAVVLLALLSSATEAAQPRSRYFLMSDGDPRNDFVLALRDPRLIDEAIAIIRMPKDRRPHVSGIIDTSTAPYNRRWAFHYRPQTISFPEVSAEVCDAETSYVQEHLKDVGGHFLPGNRWCPWNQQVVREIGARQ